MPSKALNLNTALLLLWWWRQDPPDPPEVADHPAYPGRHADESDAWVAEDKLWAIVRRHLDSVGMP